MTMTNLENNNSIHFPDKTSTEKPYVSKYLPVKHKNILQIFEDELSQPEVVGISLVKHIGLGANRVEVEPSMTIKADNKRTDEDFAEFQIPIDSENYNEAIRFIVKNNRFFAKKYSMEFVANISNIMENIPVHVYRKPAYMQALFADKQPVSTEPVDQGLHSFVGNQMGNPDVESVTMEGSSIPGEHIVTITLKSGSQVEFIVSD